MKDKKSPEFYKQFYEDNRIALLQYESLRKHFNIMVTSVLGDDYYNMAMDVYDCDRICCEDITVKGIGIWKPLIDAIKSRITKMRRLLCPLKKEQE